MKTIFALVLTFALTSASAHANSAHYVKRLHCTSDDNKLRVEILEGGALHNMKAEISERVGFRYKERASVVVKELIQTRPGGATLYSGKNFKLTYKPTSTPNDLGEHSASLNADLEGRRYVETVWCSR